MIKSPVILRKSHLCALFVNDGQLVDIKYHKEKDVLNHADNIQDIMIFILKTPQYNFGKWIWIFPKNMRKAYGYRIYDTTH